MDARLPLVARSVNGQMTDQLPPSCEICAAAAVGRVASTSPARTSVPAHTQPMPRPSRLRPRKSIAFAVYTGFGRITPIRERRQVGVDGPNKATLQTNGRQADALCSSARLVPQRGDRRGAGRRDRSRPRHPHVSIGFEDFPNGGGDARAIRVSGPDGQTVNSPLPAAGALGGAADAVAAAPVVVAAAGGGALSATGATLPGAAGGVPGFGTGLPGVPGVPGLPGGGNPAGPGPGTPGGSRDPADVPRATSGGSRNRQSAEQCAFGVDHTLDDAVGLNPDLAGTTQPLTDTVDDVLHGLRSNDLGGGHLHGLTDPLRDPPILGRQGEGVLGTGLLPP